MANYRALVPGGFFGRWDDHSLPVSLRSNNPGALNGAGWEKDLPGYVETVETTPGNKTTIFETPEEGVAAWFILMKKYHASGASTLAQIVNRYGGGQDYSAYVAQVVSWSGLDRNASINLDDDAQLLRFAKAMFHYEAGRVTPLSDEQIVYGFHLGRGTIKVDDAPAPATQPSSPPPAPVQSATPSVPPWLAIAQKEVGFHETGNNMGIDRYVAGAHCGEDGDPWCAIFVNFCLETAGVRGSRSAMARSFEHDANFVKLDGPALGAIVTNWRGSLSAGTGHVYFYVGENNNGILALGGNQSDKVCKQYEPRNRVVGYYWPKSVALPHVGKIAVNDSGAPVGGSEV